MSKEAPVPQAIAVAPAMATGGGNVQNPLETMRGAVFYQEYECWEFFLECITPQCCRCCCEFPNKYQIGDLPPGQNALTSRSDTSGWAGDINVINSLPKTLRGVENSSGCTRAALKCFGCGWMRPFVMDYMPPFGQAMSFVRLDKPCTAGGCICCPHKTDVYVNGQLSGRVIEDWNCNNWLCRYCEAVYCCRVPYKLQLVHNGQFVDRYQLMFNFCFCGPHCNVFAPTCLKNDMLLELREFGNGDTVMDHPSGHYNPTFGGCCALEAYLRFFICHRHQAVMQWNENATVQERALYVGASTLFDYVIFGAYDSSK